MFIDDVRRRQTICIVGGSGFVGEHLLNRWGGPAWQLEVLSRNPDHRRRNRVAPGSRFHAVDLYDVTTLCRYFEGAAAVVNLAGILNESGRKGTGFERVHVELTEKIIEACNAAGVSRYLHMSALKAGEGESHYLRTKGEAEERVRNSGLAWSIFRPSVIFGRDDSFLNRFAGLLKLAPVLPLACPDARMQPVYVGDVTACFDHALKNRKAAGQTYELGGPRVYTLKEIVLYVRELLELKRPVIGLPDALARMQARFFDFSPIKPFSSDNFKSLQVPSVTDDNALPRLGIDPTPMEAIAPGYIGHKSKADRMKRLRSSASR